MSAPNTDWEAWNWRDAISPEERKELLEVDDLHGWLSIAFDWAVVFAAMALVAWAPNPVTIVLALFVIGARQLGFAILALAGHPWLYLLWVVAWLTTNRLVTRIRSIAEHALTPDANDALNNTRTTVARWWERLLIAPNRVNYHLEHHLMMTVPHYKLARFHQLLRARGVLDRACVAYGYLGVLRNAASKAATQPG